MLKKLLPFVKAGFAGAVVVAALNRVPATRKILNG